MLKYLALGLFFLCGVAEAANIDDDLKNRVKFRANISAVAEWCGLDWAKRSFSPFMNKMRYAGYDNETISYIGTYHGVYMQRKANELKGLERACDSDVLQKLNKYLDK